MPKITVLPPNDPAAKHLTACTIGTYIQFVEPSAGAKHGSRNSWNTSDPYQYLGPLGAKGTYARVLHVPSGSVIDTVPRKQQVRTLELVSAEFRLETHDCFFDN